MGVYAIFLGFRAAALHLRLYSNARIRGLRVEIALLPLILNRNPL
jgi:hypothetical protein